MFRSGLPLALQPLLIMNILLEETYMYMSYTYILSEVDFFSNAINLFLLNLQQS